MQETYRKPHCGRSFTVMPTRVCQRKAERSGLTGWKDLMLSTISLVTYSACCRYAEQNTTAGWDAEWVHAYSQYEEQRRQQEDRDNTGFFGQKPEYGRRFNRSDPLGYYEALGVEPGASKQEIQV